MVGDVISAGYGGIVGLKSGLSRAPRVTLAEAYELRESFLYRIKKE